MNVKFLHRDVGFGGSSARISPSALSVPLLLYAVVWLVSACVHYATGGSQNAWRATPVSWMLILLLTPSICFALGIALVNARQPARLSGFDWCALLAAFLPVTVGTWLAVLAVKAWFWTSFLEASVGSRIFAGLATLALIPISGAMIWQTTRNYSSSQRPNARQ